MSRISIKKIKKYKNKKKITCLTAYSSSITKIIDKYVDVILIGDSLGTVIYGMKNTQKVTMSMMIMHGKAVMNSSNRAFTIIDMPYNSYRNPKEALTNAKKLLNLTKCQAIKIEADHKTIDIIKFLKRKGIIIVSHIGVTPQKFKDFGKIRHIGNTKKERERTIDLAIQLEKVGSSMIVLECIKEDLAKELLKLSESTTKKSKSKNFKYQFSFSDGCGLNRTFDTPTFFNVFIMEYKYIIAFPLSSRCVVSNGQTPFKLLVKTRIF